jgi:hypothetical protein
MGLGWTAMSCAARQIRKRGGKELGRVSVGPPGKEGIWRLAFGPKQRREKNYFALTFSVSKILCNVLNCFWFSNLFWNIQNMGWTYQHIL